MVFMKRWINHLLLTVFCLTSLPVMASESTELTKLQAEMLRLISTNEIEQFMKVTEQLKEESLKQGAERIFYKAWGNQAIFEATHQNYAKAEEIAKYQSYSGCEVLIRENLAPSRLIRWIAFPV